MPRMGRVMDSGEEVAMGGLRFQVRDEADFGQSCDGQVNGRRSGGSGDAGRADAHFPDLDSVGGRQGLRDAANTGAAVHSFNTEGEFSHRFLPFSDLMIRGGKGCAGTGCRRVGGLG